MARNLTGARVARISENGGILDLPEPKSGTTLINNETSTLMTLLNVCLSVCLSVCLHCFIDSFCPCAVFTFTKTDVCRAGFTINSVVKIEMNNQYTL